MGRPGIGRPRADGNVCAAQGTDEAIHVRFRGGTASGSPRGTVPESPRAPYSDPPACGAPATTGHSTYDRVCGIIPLFAAR